MTKMKQTLLFGFTLLMLAACSNHDTPDPPADTNTYRFDKEHLKMDYRFHEITIKVLNADIIGDWYISEVTNTYEDSSGADPYVFTTTYTPENQEDVNDGMFKKIDMHTLLLRVYANHGDKCSCEITIASLDTDHTGKIFIEREAAPDPDILWEYYPFSFEIFVRDSEGNSRLYPGSENFIAGQITAEYKGVIYTVTPAEENISTRYCPPTWNGLQLVTADWWGNAVKEPYLTFGEFDGPEFYENEEVKINWGDGSSDILSFSSHIAAPGEINRHFFFNGTEYDASNKLLIIK